MAEGLRQKGVETEVKGLETTRIVIRGAVGPFSSDYTVVLRGGYSEKEIRDNIKKVDRHWFYKNTISVHFGAERIPEKGWRDSFENMLTKKVPSSLPIEKRLYNVRRERAEEERVAAKPQQIETTTMTVSVGPTITYSITFNGHHSKKDLEGKLKDHVWLAKNIVDMRAVYGMGNKWEDVQDRSEAFRYLTGEKTLAGGGGIIRLIGEPEYRTKKV